MSSDNDSLLVQVLDEYLAGLQAGTNPNPVDLLARFPELADDIEACLTSLDFIRQAGVNSTAVAPPETSLQDGLASGVLGDYRILREVGRGGMGVVYEAEQISLARRVALKVLPFAATLDPRHLHRFRHEAQAAAQLHHPNIVPVFAVGCERGVHYYAMQFIDGHSLAAVIQDMRRYAGIENRGSQQTPTDDNHRNEGPPASPIFQSSILDPRSSYFRTVAQLGAQAAEALDHAHQCGVVHRDIKPANLLLDPGGNVWITDFGLARSPGDPGLTLSGDMLGTLRYMSPEQARGQHGRVNHHTDIYALGASLYELLTLEPAFPGADRQEVLRQIDGAAPRPPRRMNRAIPAELETIVLKAMEKVPEERYATAGELADDLRRFLDDKPIRARRPTVLARSVKWSRRHKGVLAAGVGLLLLAVVGLTVSTVLIIRQRDEAVRQRKDAEEKRRLARKAVDEMYTAVAENFLAHQPTLQPLQRVFLLKALHFYEQFAEEQGDDPSIQQDVAWAVLRVAHIHQLLGELDQAGPAYERAVVQFEKLAADHAGEHAFREGLADAHEGRCTFFMRTGVNAEAEKAIRRAISLNEQLVREDPTNPLTRGKLANNQNNLALLLFNAGRLNEAEPLWRQGLPVLEKLAHERLDEPEYARFFALNCTYLGNLLVRTGQMQDAEELFCRAADEQQRLTERYAEIAIFRQDFASTSDDLARVLVATGRPVDAERTLQLALDHRKRLVTDFPNEPDFRHGLARGYSNLGTLLLMVGKIRQAERPFCAGLSLLERLVADYPRVPLYRLDLAKCHNNWGILCGKMDRLAEAELAFRDVLACCQQLAADAPEELSYREGVAKAHNNLGVYFARTDQPQKAVEAFTTTFTLYAKMAWDNPEVPEFIHMKASASLQLAQQQRRTNALKEADEADRLALELLGKLVESFPGTPSYSRDLAWQLANCADVSRRNPIRAVDLARRATTLLPQAGENWGALGAAYCRAGKWDEAIAALDRSQQLQRGEDGAAGFFLAMAHWHLGAKGQARELYDHASSWLTTNNPHDEELQRLRAEVKQLLSGDAAGSAAEKRGGAPAK